MVTLPENSTNQKTAHLQDIVVVELETMSLSVQLVRIYVLLGRRLVTKVMT